MSCKIWRQWRTEYFKYEFCLPFLHLVLYLCIKPPYTVLIIYHRETSSESLGFVVWGIHPCNYDFSLMLFLFLRGLLLLVCKIANGAVKFSISFLGFLHLDASLIFGFSLLYCVAGCFTSWQSLVVLSIWSIMSSSLLRHCFHSFIINNSLYSHKKQTPYLKYM